LFGGARVLAQLRSARGQCELGLSKEQDRDQVVQSRSEAYLRKAEWAQREAESLLNPQEKILLLEIERSFRRLAKIEEWQDAIDLDKRQCERPFAESSPFQGEDGGSISSVRSDVQA
jgi:hypothetical protein